MFEVQCKLPEFQVGIGTGWQGQALHRRQFPPPTAPRGRRAMRASAGARGGPLLAYMAKIGAECAMPLAATPNARTPPGRRTASRAIDAIPTEGLRP
jgi:hypothetical protein